jgi:hypothetical protein
MREDGMAIKWSAWDLQDDPRVKKYAMIEDSGSDSDDGKKKDYSSRDQVTVIQCLMENFMLI